MTIKDKLKSYNFWITLVSAIILLLQVFGEKFNFKIDSNFIIDVTTGLCSIFVVLGIISVPKAKTTKTDIRFVEPDYAELSKQISNQLLQKMNNFGTLDTGNEFEENSEKPEDKYNDDCAFEKAEMSNENSTFLENDKTVFEQNNSDKQEISPVQEENKIVAEQNENELDTVVKF